MSTTRTRSGALTRATHELVVELMAAGRPEQAQLVAVALLTANPRNLQAWLLLARTLAERGRSSDASRAYVDLCRAYAAVGDLPMAVVAALDCETVGGDAAAVLQQLALSFSRSAPGLVDDWRSTPPALPGEVEVDLARATEESALQELTTAALAGARAALPTESANRRFFPLFSSLSIAAFVPFLRSLRVMIHRAAEVVIEQGHPGTAFFIIAQGEVRVTRKLSDGSVHQLARLGPGAFFGEMAIVARAPRAATVTSATDTIILRADIGALEQATRALPELREVLRAFCRSRMLENVVSASTVLRRVPQGERSAVLSLFSESVHDAGTVIISEGEHSAGLYLLVSGEVGVSRRENGDTLSIARLGSGDFFGEISLVLRRPAVASVTALSDTVCLFLPREAFIEVVESHPEILAELYQTALKREEETQSILAREAVDADDLILL